MDAITSVRATIATYTQPDKAVSFARFFKSGEGQYGAGDKFLGITVPHCRLIARQHYKGLSLDDVEVLLASAWHEERLVALFVLVYQFDAAIATQQQAIFRFYLDHTDGINNWDLVDASAYKIVGRYIFEHPEEQGVLDRLATSESLWERRIAMISTFFFLQQGDPEPTLRIAEKLLPDKHDLIQKASGWMLRELGKRVDEVLLVNFLKEHYSRMPRTTLRYAIERFAPVVRARYLAGNFVT